MLDFFYHKRLKQDLEQWVEAGWVSSSSAGHILSNIEKGDGSSRLPMALAGIGVVCVALALAAFVAANWDGIPRMVKLTGILLLVLGSHGLAALCSSKGRKGLADLATAFASLTFIVGLALVGQIFHLPSDWVGGTFLVCLGGLAAALLTGSRASLIIGAIAAMSWQFSRAEIPTDPLTVNMIGIAFLAAVVFHAVKHPFALSRWLATALLLISFGRVVTDFATGTDMYSNEQWLMLITGFACLSVLMVQVPAIIDMAIKWASSYPQRRLGHWLFMSSLQNTGMLILALMIVLSLMGIDELEDHTLLEGFASTPTMTVGVLAVVTTVLGALLSFKTSKALVLFGATFLALCAVLLPLLLPDIILLSALALGASIALVMLGTLYRNPVWSLGGYGALAAVSLWLLYETVGSLLGQALFFLVAGVLLLVIAFMAMKFMRRQTAKPDQRGGQEVRS